MTDLATAMVQHFESCRLESYLDTEGVPTIGWGHTGSDVYYPGQTCTQAQADAWLASDMAVARLDATRFPHYQDMNDVRQAVCVSMCFQMGTAPLYWPNFETALRAQDYIAASKAGLDSEWAREETPARASLEMAMLNSGVWELPTSA